MSIKTVAIIQARMNSSRLPGKVLKSIAGRPLISYMYERVLAAYEIDEVVFATSREASDNPVFEFCSNNNIPCERGSLDDVLDRYHQVAKTLKADIIVRLTGDCPIIDPAVIDDVVNTFKQSDYDYVANTAPPEGFTYPEGMDVEVFSMFALEQAWSEAKKPSDREHVTFYFWKNLDKFNCFRCDMTNNLSEYRLTVDYPEDFVVIEAILNALYKDGQVFSMTDILTFLDSNPDIREINSNIESFSGWKPSLQKDLSQEFNKS